MRQSLENSSLHGVAVVLTRAQRLKRVFKIDILTCARCGGADKVIASIEDPILIKKILEHLDLHAEPARRRNKSCRA